MYGLGIQDPTCAIVHAPLTVLPTPFPRESFARAKRAMTVFNLVMDAVSRDADYLQRTLAKAAQFDDFTVRSARPSSQAQSCSVLAQLLRRCLLHPYTTCHASMLQHEHLPRRLLPNNKCSVVRHADWKHSAVQTS